MPTNRTRHTRTRRLDLEVYALFAVGCGWCNYAPAQIAKLWKQHRDVFLATCPEPNAAFATMMGLR